MEKFINRHEAGRILADQLRSYAKQPDVIVLALPRGGVPVGYEIAKALSVPLDVFIVRKLGVPGHEELAMGAIASGDTTIFNEDIVEALHVSKEAIDEVIHSEEEELKRREILYRHDEPFPKLQDKIVILVDDGVATGATMRAAIKAIRQNNPARLVMAIPVAAFSTYQEMSKLVDEIVCPLQPLHFYAVGLWYEDFAQTTDDEVSELLANKPDNPLKNISPVL
ncbi:phosphoribosyltransferase [Legionella hackeliae]|uniref:Phosphoribosyltransferase like protein n=1 Tax=Legionella hackeliae TaxID=449 RepID=A0A0A8UTX5_LEGHA|nr:phosphoribosyltransferase [Legionella hackeliae]KTD13841.1 phosphoribosyltransferase [Legionella hackeliae]CEK10542.1 phosphoribosyltransferase like protein [Legionella hackeliae]STX47281.1 phosphoribosyltransferase [Legionella hackeliae]